MINFEDFQKIDLRVGKILKAERVENSEKLLRLEVDLGEEKREIVAGIGKYYAPEDILEKEVVVVCNLEPKNIMGIESHGMILAADNNGEPVLLGPDKEVFLGAKIK
ncbi:MAG TPA: methionine--tRNA ligase subunit beta [Candidatus Pacearchaeota archaeon]|nr:methionine--tRNA ligase subunit beta [Candidatus Pacearchaeota archaeon]